MRAARSERTIQTVKPFSPHSPSTKQRAFLDLDAEEALYGGSAGGGKSDALILGALQYIDVPGYSAGLFRRTKEDLNKPGAILDRARNWFQGTRAVWDDKFYGFRFSTGPGRPDATIHFGYATSKRDMENRYQGTEFQYIGIDELSQWMEDAYRYAFSRLRRLKRFPVPIRIRGGTNPGGVGALWVRSRFIENARHLATGIDVKEYLRRRKAKQAIADPPYFVSPPGAEAQAIADELGRKAQGSYFVPAFAEDNPGLDVAEYRGQLAKLDTVTRVQLADGDWWAVAAGNYFQAGWFRYEDAAPAGLNWVRYWDLAGTKLRPERKHDPDWSAGAKMGIQLLPDKSSRIWLAHMAHFREDPGGTERNVRGTAELDGKRVAQWFEEEPGSAGKNNTHNYQARILFGWMVFGHRKTGPKPEYWKPLSAVASSGNFTLVRGPWNEEFVQELCALPVGHDDQADAGGGALSVLVGDDSIQRARTLANNW